MRNILLMLMSGILLGLVVATAIAPGYLTWYSTPGQGQALCDCAELTKSTATSLIRAQVVGAGAGGFVFVVLAIVRAVKKRNELPPPPPAVPPRQSPAPPSSSTPSGSPPPL